MKSILIVGLVESECEYDLQHICNEVHTVNDWFNFYDYNKLRVTHSWRTHINCDYNGSDGRIWHDNWIDEYNVRNITMLSREPVNGLKSNTVFKTPFYMSPIYFNSSLCYIMHYALKNRFDKVYLTGILMKGSYDEYLKQLPVLLMWIDLLREFGIAVEWRKEKEMRKLCSELDPLYINQIYLRKSYYGTPTFKRVDYSKIKNKVMLESK